MAALMMKIGASQLSSNGMSLQPSSPSAWTNCTSLISLRLNLATNLTSNLKKSNLTTKIYGVAKEPADGKSLSRAVMPGSLGIRIDNAPFEHSVPAWGLSSIIGRRRTLEDAVVAIPEFHQVHVIGDHGTTIPAAFFGVYDGHGGSQVAKYCRDRLHSALAEELEGEVIMANLNDTSKVTCEEVWRRALTKCFRRVDDEVGGKAGVGPHVAPSTSGSTAIVAIVCPTYIVVANCGDSRAVLKRDRESIALSVDHKTTREDEYARIEAAGGKVIKWNPGNGECGVLRKYDDNGDSRFIAMSRAIGDRYWKPWVIPDPEVKIIPRTIGDRCLILASDGLWDVMTNDEVCDIASERILNWYARNGQSLPTDGGVESASRAAADYLSHRAFEKLSRDNISVVVVDLESL